MQIRMKQTRLIAATALIAILPFAASCATTPYTDRTRLMLTTEAQENEMGEKSYREFMAKAVPSRNQAYVRMVERVGKRLAAVAGKPDYKWEFTVVESKEVNAFCLPGGKMVVYTAILPVCQTDAGLATVMGHEIAHAVARHGAERMAHQKLAQIGTLAAGVALSDMDYRTQRTVLGALGVGAQFGILLPFSREHESEADYMGIVYAAKACFDPTEAPKLWERMQEMAGSRSTAEFMSTHPSHATRIRQLQEWMPEALEIRKKNCGS